MFENPEIPLHELPRAETVDWLAMDQKFLRRQLTESFIVMVFVTLGVAAVRTIASVATAADDVQIPFGLL